MSRKSIDDLGTSLLVQGRGPVVLLAEDHDDSRQIYSLILRHYGYEVFEAVTGVQAVELARAGCPALILMDIGLPLLDGWEASKLIKADPLTRRVPIIAFSARVDSTADLGGAQPVFDGFIQKPVSPLQLVSRVAAYLELLGGAAGFASSGVAGSEVEQSTDARA